MKETPTQSSHKAVFLRHVNYLVRFWGSIDEEMPVTDIWKGMGGSGTLFRQASMLPSLFSAGRISFGIFLPHALFLVKFCSRLVLLMVWGGCSCGSATDALWEGGAAGDDRYRKDPQWMMSLGSHRISLWPLYILSMLCLWDLRTSYAWESHQ